MWGFDDIAGVAGIGGVAVYLGSYAALQAGLLRGNGYLYASLNLLAASLVLASLMVEFNLSSAIIQISWIIISAVGITRIFLQSRALRFSAEEEEVRMRRFPILSRIEARRLLNAGQWREGSAGHVLTTEGDPVRALFYIASGEVDVRVRGQTVAQVGPGALIGEMACLDEGPASATTRLATPTRYLEIPSEALTRQIRRDPDLATKLDFVFAGYTRDTLRATNTKLSEALIRTRDPLSETRADESV